MEKYIDSERVDLFEPNIYIQFQVQIIGNPLPEEIVTAIKKAFLANEVTMSKIEFDGLGNSYYKRMEESGCKVSIVKDKWLDLMRMNEKIPFAIDQGEFIRVFVIMSKEGTYLFLMAHHLVGDGKSITYFLEDIMRALSGEKLEYKEMELITQESMPPKSELPKLVKLYASRYNHKWKSTGRIFHWKDYYKIHETYWKDRSSQVLLEYFTPEELTQIHKNAKQIGVSVNSYIITAFLEANRENSIIGIAVNARKDNNKSMSNQATGISVNHTYSDRLGFKKNAQLIHRKALFKLAKPVTKYFILRFIPLFQKSLIDSALFFTYGLYQNKISQKFAKLMGYAGGQARELGITNLTRLDIPNVYGEYELRNVIFIPPVVSYAKHIIGVVTMGDGMTISYHFMSDQNKEKETEFFKHAIKNLKVEEHEG